MDLDERAVEAAGRGSAAEVGSKVSSASAVSTIPSWPHIFSSTDAQNKCFFFVIEPRVVVFS